MKLNLARSTDSQMNPKELEELKDALAKSTPGEWEVGGPYPHVSVIVQTYPGTGWSTSGPPEQPEFDAIATGLRKEDAEFIVAAKNHLPSLLTELAALRRQVEEAKKTTAIADGRCNICGSAGYLKHHPQCPDRETPVLTPELDAVILDAWQEFKEQMVCGESFAQRIKPYFLRAIKEHTQ